MNLDGSSRVSPHEEEATLMEGMRRCPYCDEEIRTEAIRCRHCRSRLTAFDPSSWYRDMPDRRVAGVAAAVAHACAIPVTAARFAFLVLTPFHLLGAITYGALWLLVPFRPGEEPPFGRLVRVARRIVDDVRDAVFARRTPPPAGTSGGSPPPHDDVPMTGVPC
jgi:phage shock protein PspC (stress-responsive transcriptional regulator)